MRPRDDEEDRAREQREADQDDDPQRQPAGGRAGSHRANTINPSRSGRYSTDTRKRRRAAPTDRRHANAPAQARNVVPSTSAPQRYALPAPASRPAARVTGRSAAA